MSRFSPHRHDREILRLGVPALGALIAQPLYVLADTAVVGHLGTPQLAGLSVATAVLLTGYAVFIFLAYGTTAVVGRYLGAGDERRAAGQAVDALWLALGLGIAAAALLWIFTDPVLRALGAEGPVLPHARTYLRVSLVGVPATLVTLAGVGYLRGLQDTRTPLVLAAATAVGNLALELVLIPGLGYGIGASALSTVLAEGVTAVVYVTVILRAARALGAQLRPTPAAVVRQAVIGRDLFLRTAALRGSLTLATAVAARVGVAELAAHEVALQIWSLLALALDAVAIAGQAMIARLLGAGEAGEAREAGRRMIEWGVGLGVAFAVVVLAVRPVLGPVFSSDDEVVRLATYLLLWVALLQPINAVVFVLDGVLIGAGDQRFLAWAMLAAASVFAPVVLAVMWLDAGIGWVWASLGLLMVARLATLTARFAGDAWAVTGAER